MIDLQHKKTPEDEVFVLENLIEALKTDNEKLKSELNETKLKLSEPQENTFDSCPDSIAIAMSNVMKNITSIKADKKNGFAKYDYMSIDAVLNTVRPLMASAGLVIVPVEDKVNIEQHKEGADINIRYKLIFVCGKDTWLYPVMRHGSDKYRGAVSLGTCQSYMLKQFYRGLFAIPTGDYDQKAIADAEKKAGEIEDHDKSDSRSYDEKYAKKEPKTVNLNTKRSNDEQ